MRRLNKTPALNRRQNSSLKTKRFDSRENESPTSLKERSKNNNSSNSSCKRQKTLILVVLTFFAAFIRATDGFFLQPFFRASSVGLQPSPPTSPQPLILFSSESLCPLGRSNIADNSDCRAFYQCLPTLGGHSVKLIEKSCGPWLMFNPEAEVCDWPYKVAALRPECRKDLYNYNNGRNSRRRDRNDFVPLLKSNLISQNRRIEDNKPKLRYESLPISTLKKDEDSTRPISNRKKNEDSTRPTLTSNFKANVWNFLKHSVHSFTNKFITSDKTAKTKEDDKSVESETTTTDRPIRTTSTTQTTTTTTTTLRPSITTTTIGPRSTAAARLKYTQIDSSKVESLRTKFDKMKSKESFYESINEIHDDNRPTLKFEEKIESKTHVESVDHVAVQDHVVSENENQIDGSQSEDDNEIDESPAESRKSADFYYEFFKKQAEENKKESTTEKYVAKTTTERHVEKSTTERRVVIDQISSNALNVKVEASTKSNVDDETSKESSENEIKNNVENPPLPVDSELLNNHVDDKNDKHVVTTKMKPKSSREGNNFSKIIHSPLRTGSFNINSLRVFTPRTNKTSLKKAKYNKKYKNGRRKPGYRRVDYSNAARVNKFIKIKVL